MNPTPNMTTPHGVRPADSPRPIDRVFSEVGRLQSNVFVFWVSGLMMASLAPGMFFWASHPGDPGNMQLILSFWSEAEPARNALRGWLLPMASIVLALMAIPTVSIAPSVEESVDRRAQQVLYLRIQMVSAFALTISSWMLLPFPVGTPEAVGSVLLCAAVALLSSGVLAVITVSSDERRHLLDSYRERRARIDTELRVLGARPYCETTKWWRGNHQRFMAEVPPIHTDRVSDLLRIPLALPSSEHDPRATAP